MNNSLTNKELFSLYYDINPNKTEDEQEKIYVRLFQKLIKQRVKRDPELLSTVKQINYQYDLLRKRIENKH